MKKVLCVLILFIFGIENAFAAEVSRLYLVENANSQQVKTLFKPAFNKIGYNLIEKNYYQIYENPAQNLYNIVVLKPNGNNCYYYYLSNENQTLNKGLLEILDDYGYDYKRIRNRAFLDLFYNDATEFMAKSKSGIRTVSKNHQHQTAQIPPQYEKYDFSDEAQQRFDNGGITKTPQQPIQITPSNVLVGSLVHIEAGTQFNAVLSSGISSESISNNDRISAQLMEDWMFNGIVIAPAGSIVSSQMMYFSHIHDSDPRFDVCTCSQCSAYTHIGQERFRNYIVGTLRIEIRYFYDNIPVSIRLGREIGIGIAFIYLSGKCRRHARNTHGTELGAGKRIHFLAGCQHGDRCNQ